MTRSRDWLSPVAGPRFSNFSFKPRSEKLHEKCNHWIREDSQALASDDEAAIAPVADLAKQLGFAPVNLGKLNEGGTLVHARGKTWGPLIFQDFFKKVQ